MQAPDASAPLDIDALRSVLERTMNGVAYCRMVYERGVAVDFVYLYTNPAFHRQTGLGPAVGRRVSELVGDLRRSDPALLERYAQVAAGGPPQRFEVFLQALHEWFAVEVFSPRDEHFVAIFDVITERKRMMLELKRHHDHLEQLVAERTAELALAKAEAEAASKAKSAFLANMTHEIRTPLSAIIGMAELVVDAGVTPQQRDRLGKIERAGRHLLEVVNAILDLSRIEAGEYPSEQTDFELDDVLQTVVELVQPHAEAKGLTLAIEAGVPGRWHGHRTWLQQALLNYAANAVKFTEAGTVTLRVVPLDVDAAGHRVRFEVDDSGCGIEPQALARLFQPFEQADGTIARRFGGSGLGLAITRRLAGMMGGEAGAQSRPGVGSRFWFTARLAPAQTTDAPAATPAALPCPGGASVLIAEDDPVNREIAVAALQGLGLAIDVASDGTEALERFDAGHHDLVLLDVHMPRLDGLAVARRIRAQPRGAAVPLLALTAAAMDDNHAECLAAGFDVVMTKPFRLDALRDTVGRLLRGRATRVGTGAAGEAGRGIAGAAAGAAVDRSADA